MNILLNISPVLAVADILTEIEFFNKLGFSSVYDSLTYSDRLDYAVLKCEDQTVHLQLFENDLIQGQQFKIWVTEIKLVDKMLRENELILNQNYKTPWNTNEIGVYSPSKHAVIFVQELC